MKRTITAVLAGTALLVGILPAQADHRWHRRDRVTIIERQGPDLRATLGVLLLGEMFAQVARQRQPMQEPDGYQPKLQDPLRAPPPRPLK